MRDRRIDENRPELDEPQHRRELHALGERSRDQGGCDDRERHLETDIDGLGNRRRERIGIANAHLDITLQEDTVEPADKWRAGAKSQAIGHGREQHSHETGNGEACHDRVGNVLPADHSAIEESQAWNGHHQDQRHGREHPSRVARIGRACRQDMGVAGRRRGVLRRGWIDEQQHRQSQDEEAAGEKCEGAMHGSE